MLFRHNADLARSQSTLQHALRAAIARHQANHLRELLHQHGAQAYAGALSPLPGPVIADALSILQEQDRIRVQRLLTADARRRYTPFN